MKNLLQSELRKLIFLRANWLLLLWSGLFAALGTVAPILGLGVQRARLRPLVGGLGRWPALCALRAEIPADGRARNGDED